MTRYARDKIRLLQNIMATLVMQLDQVKSQNENQRSTISALGEQLAHALAVHDRMVKDRAEMKRQMAQISAMLQTTILHEVAARREMQRLIAERGIP